MIFESTLHVLHGNTTFFIVVHCNCRYTINQSDKSQNVPVPYPTIHLYGAETVPYWCIVGCGAGALWDLWDCSIGRPPGQLSPVRQRHPLIHFPCSRDTSPMSSLEFHHFTQPRSLAVSRGCLDSLTVSLDSPNGRHLPAVRVVQGDC